MNKHPIYKFGMVLIIVCITRTRQQDSVRTDWDIRANLLHPLGPRGFRKSHIPVDKDNNVAASSSSSVVANFDRLDLRTNYRALQRRDCLEKIDECERTDGICKLDLNIYRKFCGDWTDKRSLMGCTKQFVMECRAALNTMNHGRPDLVDCTCNAQASRSIEDLAKCNLLRRNLNRHPCLADPPVFLDARLQELEPSNIRTNHPTKFQSQDKHTVQWLPDITVNRVQQTFANEEKQSPDSNNIVQYNKSDVPESGKQTEQSKLETSTTVSSVSSGRTQSEPKIYNVKPDSIRNLVDIPEDNSSCLDRLQDCIRHASCANALNQYRAMCNPRSCEKLGAHCLLAYEAFNQFGIYQNKCNCKSEPDALRKQRCLDFENAVLKNRCVESMKSSIMEKNHSNIDEQLLTLPTIPSLIGPDGGYSAELRQSASQKGDKTHMSNPVHPMRNQVVDAERLNCYDIYMQCVRNGTCLWHYLRIISSCVSRSNNQACPVSPVVCEKEIKHFYNQLEDFAIKGIMCKCHPGDLDCLQQQAIFRPSCKHKSINLRSVQCSTVWKECMNNLKCRTQLLHLAIDCKSVDTVCLTEPLHCNGAYRNLWVEQVISDCYCETGDIFQLDTVRSAKSIDCERFRHILLHPPCDHFTDTRKLQDNKKSTDSCFLSERLNLPKTTTFRIPEEPLSTHLSIGMSSCSRLCSCQNGCPHRFCALLPQISDGREHQTMSKATYRPEHQTRLIPEMDFSCRRVLENNIWCDTTKKSSEVIPGYHLMINYDLAEYDTIFQLLTGNSLRDGRRYIKKLLNFEQIITSLIRNVSRNDNCGILFNGYQLLMPKNKSDVSEIKNGEGSARLFYAITTVSTDKPLRSDDVWLRVSCLHSIRLLVVMINHRFPLIQYNPLLSVLKFAVLSDRPTAILDPKTRPSISHNETTNSMISTGRQARTSLENFGHLTGQKVETQSNVSMRIALSSSFSILLLSIVHMIDFYPAQGG